MDKALNDRDFKVDFIVLGAMKSGTTTLFQILNRHSQVAFCTRKECDFFSKEDNWSDNLDKYRQYFPGEIEGKMVGEASTSYTAYPHYNKRIWSDLKEFNPDLRLIYIMRDPIDRCISHYMHFFTRRYTKLPPDQAIFEIPEIIGRSKYFMQIDPYLQYFGEERVKLLLLEEFKRDPKAGARDIFNFLGLAQEDTVVEGSRSNPGIDNGRVHHKTDKLFKFLYENRLGKSVHRIVPSRIRKMGASLVTHSLSSRPVLGDDTLEYIVRSTISDVRQIESLLGVERIECWTQYNQLRNQIFG